VGSNHSVGLDLLTLVCFGGHSVGSNHSVGLDLLTLVCFGGHSVSMYLLAPVCSREGHSVGLSMLTHTCVLWRSFCKFKSFCGFEYAHSHLCALEVFL
jgi:hypothetical protein